MSAPPGFEVLRLAAEEVAEGVAIVELEGRWTADAPPAEKVRLLVDGHRVAPVRGTVSVRDEVLRASFAVEAGGLDEGVALVAPGVRVRLPEPDGARSDRLAALAREVNDLRHARVGLGHERDTVAAERDEVRAERDALAAERDALAAERDAWSSERDGLLARVEELVTERDELLGSAGELAALRRQQQDAGALREERDAVVRERDELRLAAQEVDALRRERDAARAALASAAEDQAGGAATTAVQTTAPRRFKDPEGRPAVAPRRHADAHPVRVAAEVERPLAVYYALAGLGVFGFLLVLILLL